MFEELLVDALKKKLQKRTAIRQRLTDNEKSKLFAMAVDTMGVEDRLRLLRTCAMRGYIE